MLPVKVKRDIALIEYRNMPLYAYHKNSNTEYYYYPKTFSCKWIKLEKATTKSIVKEFIKLIQLLEINSVVIMGSFNKPWVSKRTKMRKDFKPLIKVIDYFDKMKITKKFNGAIKVAIEDLKLFLSPFYRLTRCDSGFSDYHILDIDQKIIFHIQ